MTTQDVANKWRDMCQNGNNLDCVNELYAENVVSQEMPNAPNPLVKGKQNVWNKGREWYDSVEEYHSGEISEPVVAGNHFTSKMKMDVTFKNQGRMQMEEVGVYKVENGKIVNEQFFYDM
jgi:limonene-1,2-epoxide hydrolase